MTAPTEKQRAVWNAWVAARPERVRVVAERFEPWNEYQFKETKRVCTLYSFEEGEKITLKVIAPQLFGMTHLVFGIDPDDLEPRDEHCVDPRDMFPLHGGIVEGDFVTFSADSPEPELPE